VRNTPQGKKLEATSSDSEKEILAATNEAQMTIVTVTPNNEGWRKVEKKKGRKA